MAEGQGRCILDALCVGCNVFCIEYSSMKDFSCNGNLKFIKHNMIDVNCPIYNNLTFPEYTKWG